MAKKSKNPKQAEEAEQEDVETTEEESVSEEGAENQAPETADQKSEPEPLEIRLLRLQADFDNYRKRMVRERQEWTQRAAENLMEDLLPVIDHYEMGLSTAEKSETEQSVIDGFRLVYTQLNSVLKKHGVVPIEAEGEVFDPHLHEAITHFPSPDHDADVIISQTRRGYTIGEKLLRPSQVVVSSGAPGAETSEALETEPSEREN